LAEAQKFFQREALVLKKLGSVSDHIPTLIDYFIEDDEFYIVQERIDGELLGKQFRSGKPQSQVDTIKLLTEILEPLDFVHGGFELIDRPRRIFDFWVIDRESAHTNKSNRKPSAIWVNRSSLVTIKLV
jgi:serine/threonine protein kinase